MIRVICPHCQSPLQAADKLLGRTVRCPDCRKRFPAKPARRPRPVPPPRPADSVRHTCPMCGTFVFVPRADRYDSANCPGCGEVFALDPPRRQIAESLRRQLAAAAPYCRGAVCLAGFAAAAWTFHDPPGLSRIWGYFGLVAGICLLRRPVTDRWPIRWAGSRGVFLALAIGAAVIYHSTAAYESVWTSDVGTTYHDSIRRSGERLYYRVMWGRDFAWHAEGPMTGTTKPHGHWRETIFEPYQVSHHWYWYGVEVSEGEWHLRNRH